MEKKLIQSGAVSTIDAVVVPHHGSKTSSSVDFVKHIKAQVAIAQAGHYNRYRHPDPVVSKRWMTMSSGFYSTVNDGAVMLRSTALGLETQTERAKKKRYWH